MNATVPLSTRFNVRCSILCVRGAALLQGVTPAADVADLLSVVFLRTEAMPCCEAKPRTAGSRHASLN